jgi:TonB family protein
MGAFVKILLPLALFGRLAERVILAFDPSFGAQPGGAGLAVLTGVIDPTTALASKGISGTAALRMLPLGLTIIWTAGTFYGLASLLRSLIRTRRLHGPTPSGLGAAERARMERALSATSIPPDRVMVVEALSIPCVSGIMRPRILIPARLLAALPAEELRALLIHEDAHRRRREPLRSALLSFCSTLCFFYPLMKVVRRRLEYTSELLCDAQVLRRGLDPDTYARALARAVRMGMEPEEPALAFAGREGPSLRDRLQRIQSPRRYVAMKRHYFIVTLVIGLIALGTLPPLQLLTGCNRDQRQAPATVEPPPASPAADPTTSETAGQKTDTNAKENRPGADEFIAVEQMPVMLDSPHPVYPPEAKASGIEGSVTIRMLIGKDGKVEEAFVSTHADPSLDQAALTAAREATFRPATQKGKPVAVWVNLPIRFALD